MEEKPIIHSKSSIIKIGLWIFIIISMILIIASYLINDEFRNIIDTKILRKEIMENASNVIEINSDSNPYIYAYDKYITILSKNVLNIYNQDANSIKKIDVNITTPYMKSEDKYLVIGEKNGQKIYLITELGVKWEKDIEGEIERINVNKNGYVSVILKDSINQSVIAIFNTEGEELFRTYSKTYIVSSEISPNNKYLAIGKIDYSGAVVKSIVELISIDSAQKNSQTNSILYKYESESGKVLNNIKFNSKNEAICMFDSYVQKITTLSDERIYDMKKDDIFVDVNLDDNFVVMEKENSGLFSYQYQINIKNTIGKSDKLYILEEDMPKNLYVTPNIICMKLLGEVRIVNSNGWLIKRYTTKSEIQDIILSESIIGIIYNNKIEVINL